MVEDSWTHRSKVTVLLVEDHELAARGIKGVLSTEPRIQVVGEAASASEAIALIGQLKPDLVISDIRLHQSSGIEVAAAINSMAVDTKLLILSAYDDDAYVASLTRLGISGYLPKTASSSEFLNAVLQVANGGLVFTAGIAEKVMGLLSGRGQNWSALAAGNLSARETEILRHIVSGLMNREICEVTGLSIKTVETYVRRMLRKLGARNRTQAALIARESGLLI